MELDLGTCLGTGNITYIHTHTHTHTYSSFYQNAGKSHIEIQILQECGKPHIHMTVTYKIYNL
jgi:hypothetical protein